MNDESLEGKIKKWLNEQGYPLEMHVSSILHKKGFNVIQSEYYTDPETGDLRELDVVAFIQKAIHNVLFRISLHIECKKSTEKPWLLFTSNKSFLAKPACVSQRATNLLARYYLSEVCHKENIQELSIFKLPKNTAYGITQAFTSGKDIPYSAVTSVSKSALASVEELDEMRRKERKRIIVFRRDTKIISVIFPVVVIDGLLFEMFLDEQNNVDINKIDCGVLLWRNPIVGMPHTIINIVTSTFIEKYINDTISSIEKFFNISKQYPDEIIKAIEKEFDETSYRPQNISRKR